MKQGDRIFKNNIVFCAISISALAVCIFAFAACDSSSHAEAIENDPEKVTYISEGQKISALLHIPADYAEGEKRPAIVFVRPASGVKEQTAGLYAKLMSDRGFVTLSFDPRGFGESEGLSRQLENPFGIGEDAQNAISYLGTLPEVDPNNIFLVGICMGSWYGAYTTALDPRVNAMAMISPAMTGRELFMQMSAMGDFRSSEYFMSFGQARQAGFVSGGPIMMPVIPTEGPTAEDPNTMAMANYYLNSDIQEQGYADHTNWINELDARSGQFHLAFSPSYYMEMLGNLPVYMAVGTEENFVYPIALDYFSKLQGPKELLELPAGHFDLYWMPELTTPISDGIDVFFRQHLKSGT